MKKLLTVLSVFFIGQTVFAQTMSSDDRVFKKFKVDLSIGYAAPLQSVSGYNYNGGVLLALEPKYAVMDELAVGLRMEEAVIVHVYADNNNSSQNYFSGFANKSYLATTDYYFTNRKFRPFVGAGAGLVFTAIIDSADAFSNSVSNLSFSSHFGFMGRLGFEAGHFRLAVEYNAVPNNASYIGIKIGGFFGGGMKE